MATQLPAKELTVTELREKKDAMEQQLLILISSILRDFTANTGVQVDYMMVDFKDNENGRSMSDVEIGLLF